MSLEREYFMDMVREVLLYFMIIFVFTRLTWKLYLLFSDQIDEHILLPDLYNISLRNVRPDLGLKDL